MIILVGVLVSAQDYEFDEKIPLHKKKADPNMISATEHQMTIRSSEGDLKMGTDSGDHFRAESRDKNNEVQGVYGWIDPSGSTHTIAYNSGIHGYRTVPVSSSGITLPPFPKSLYATSAEKRSKPAIFGGPTIQIRPKLPFVGPIEESNRDFGDDDLVVISADENQSEESNGDVDIIEAPIDSLDSESPPVITLPENILGGLQIGLGTPVAVSNPSVAAVAGDQGTAHVKPAAQAFVGPGGVAISLPSAQAAVGLQGVAVSTPVAVSSAGQGGVAIAGGTSVASAGLDNSMHHIKYRASGSPPIYYILPTINNYYSASNLVPKPTLYNQPSYKTSQPLPYPYNTMAIDNSKTAQYSPLPKQDFFYRSNPTTFETVSSANNYAQFKQNN